MKAGHLGSKRGWVLGNGVSVLGPSNIPDFLNLTRNLCKPPSMIMTEGKSESTTGGIGYHTIGGGGEGLGPPAMRAMSMKILHLKTLNPKA